MKYHETEAFKMFKEAFINGQVKSDELYSLIRFGCYIHSENKFDLKEFVYCMGIISESMGHFYTEDERVSFMYHIDLEKYKNDTRDELITNFDNASLGYSDDFILLNSIHERKPRNQYKEDAKLDAEIERYNIIKYDFALTDEEEKEFLILDKKIKLLLLIKTVFCLVLSLSLKNMLPYCAFLTIGSILLLTGHFSKKEGKIYDFIKIFLVGYLLLGIPYDEENSISLYLKKKGM